MIKKHKIFKVKLIWIDWLFVLGLFFAVFYSLKTFKRDKATVYVDLTFKHQEWLEYPMPPEYWQVSQIKKGDIFYGHSGEKLAEVVEVDRSFWGADKTWINLVVKLQGTFDHNTNAFVFNGDAVLVGKELELELGNTYFRGLIENVYSDLDSRFKGYDRAKAHLKIKYRYLEPWHAEAIQDLKVINSSGKEEIRVLGVKVVPAEVVVETSSGGLVRQLDPIKKDVEVELDIPEVWCTEGNCYFNYYPLKIGNSFWLAGDKTMLTKSFHSNDNGSNKLDIGSVMEMEIEYLEKSQ